jgi:hypothetical protein
VSSKLVVKVSSYTWSPPQLAIYPTREASQSHVDARLLRDDVRAQAQGARGSHMRVITGSRVKVEFLTY